MKYFRLNLNEVKSIEPEDLTIRKEKKKTLRKINIKGKKIDIDRESMEKSRSFKNQPKYYLKNGRWHAVDQLHTTSGIKNTHYNVAPGLKETVSEKVNGINLPENLKQAIAPALAAGVAFLVAKKLQDYSKEPKIKAEFIDVDKFDKDYKKYKMDEHFFKRQQYEEEYQRRQIPKQIIAYSLAALTPVMAAAVYNKYKKSRLNSQGEYFRAKEPGVNNAKHQWSEGPTVDVKSEAI